ncbi:MAG: anthranilate synthase component I [Alphaproteobacteria bacterium]|nr:anthranilate synthase component I [Alphaproteobacteria bacterium]
MPTPTTATVAAAGATPGGFTVHRRAIATAYAGAIEPLIDALDSRRGVLLASSFEYPGRYTRWDIGFVDPPVALGAAGREVRVEALNDRGRILLPAFAATIAAVPAVEAWHATADTVSARVRPAPDGFAEEERARQPSVFSLLRAVVASFRRDGDTVLGLYGAFGYDLAFQFEPIRLRHARDRAQRDLVLYLPDEVLVVDHRRETAMRHRYEFTVAGRATEGIARDGGAAPFRAEDAAVSAADHAPGEYAATVRVAREAFARGDLFEVVPSQTLLERCPAPPSEIFRRLRRRNPAPYGALMNLGAREHLVAASPEMYVRVQGDRVETCPISGTIARGADALGDAAQILTLLASDKEAAELTMCTDVDRNDKSRVCVPGSVRIIGRRQIEMYSRLIHTVDHVEGRLRPECDALDAFLAHAWAVTVTGAPKRAAMQFIEDHERSPRRWYGGAIGMIGFDGGLNTGLTLRTVHIRDGIAAVRVGATLLFDSDPEAEEAETRLKAAALLDAIRRPEAETAGARAARPSFAGRRLLFVDHEDSFVHTLASYFRETGATVTTRRADAARARLMREAFDLVVLSPGPGTPDDFAVPETIARARAAGLPVFGVCLGLQGIVVHFGGTLARLAVPAHGKPSLIRNLGGRILDGLPERFVAGRYHSLIADRASLPAALRVTAESEDGHVMALEHAHEPIAAVQFHPESLLSLEGGLGRALVDRVLGALMRH